MPRMLTLAAAAVASGAMAVAAGRSGASATTNPTFAFTYTTPNQTWMSAVQQGNLNSVFVYAGDVEFYCLGSPTATSGGCPSPADLQCVFNGTSPNAFVYYTDAARNTSAEFKAAGYEVYINFDGRITPKLSSFVPNFSLMSPSTITAFAQTTAALVCGDPNVDGMAWDVEPFSNDQIPFFAALDAEITACGKRWGVFGFGETFNATMWTTGLGDSGFLFDSTYDLDCTSAQLPPNGCLPCQCTPPDVYETVLTQHLQAVMAAAQTYQKPYRLMVSGSGTTQLYESISTSTCSGAGGGPVYNATCGYTMDQWMSTAVGVFDTLNVRNDPNFEGIGVYGWTTTNGGGFSPVVPPTAALTVLANSGYLPYAAPTSDKPAVITPLQKLQGPHNSNKCALDADYKTCPQHYMLGSPMNDQL